MANQEKLIIIQPDGSQGVKLGLQFKNKKQFQSFDEAVGELPLESRKDVESLRKVANQVGITVVKP